MIRIKFNIRDITAVPSYSANIILNHILDRKNKTKPLNPLFFRFRPVYINFSGLSYKPRRILPPKQPPTPRLCRRRQQSHQTFLCLLFHDYRIYSLSVTFRLYFNRSFFAARNISRIKHAIYQKPCINITHQLAAVRTRVNPLCNREFMSFR